MVSRSYVLIALVGGAVALLAGCGAGTSNRPISAGPLPASGSAGNMHAKVPPTPAAPAPKHELPIPEHFSIDAWVDRYSEEYHRSFQTQLDRALAYVVPVQEIFESSGLPKDLVYVALVESGFKPKARSHANAVGMWQFIPATGKRFGLEQNRWIDERCHPFKAATAAADYLSFLYDTFGSWPLALAAYNTGEKNVQEALDQSGMTTFWDLAENGLLAAETRDYVPKLLAAVKIIRDPRHYGFHFNPAHHSAPSHETVCVPGGVKLSWVGKQIGVPQDSLEDSNPELCKPVTPPGCSSYELCVPAGKGEDLLAALAKRSYQEEKVERKAVAAASPKLVDSYEARPGDTWLGLARKYKCSAQALASMNGVTTSHVLKVGQKLKVPGGKSRITLASIQTRNDKNKPSTRKTDEGKSTSRERKPSKPTCYPVRRGDTLSSIAEKFRTSVKALCAQNELSENHKLIPGSIIEIRTSQQN